MMFKRKDKHTRIRRVFATDEPCSGVEVELTCRKYGLPNNDSTAPILRVYDEEDPSKALRVVGQMPAHTSADHEQLTLSCSPSLVHKGMIVEAVGNAWDTVDVTLNEFGRIPSDVEYEFPFATEYEA